jgi:hypothetical protein
MRRPMRTADPYADADALDRYYQERQSNYNYKRCRKCHDRIEDGCECFEIPCDCGELLIFCENCIGDFSKVVFYE